MDPDPLLLSFCVLAAQGTIAPFVILLILLLIGSALISAAEVAYFSLSPNVLNDLGKEGSVSGQNIVQLRARPRRLLATILISNNFINIAIVIISEIVLRRAISDETFFRWAQNIQDHLGTNILPIDVLSTILSSGVTVVAVTFLLVLFGEVAPKIYANSNNVRHARLMSRPLTLLSLLFSPITRVLLSWTGGIEERVYRNRLKSKAGGADKKEIDRAIELTVSNQAEQEEVDILKGIIKFGDVETRQIMKSRVDIVGIDISESISEVINLIKESGFSRLPVYEENLDSITGILYVKDLLGHTRNQDISWQSLIQPNVLYVPETKKIDELLKEFQTKRTHMAIVVDEYGGCSGLVTLEDVMEEIVGDIRDEFDHEEDIEYEKIDENNYVFEGKTLLNDVIRVMNLESDVFEEGRGSSDSLAGLILELESLIPKRGKTLQYKHLKISILSATSRRIEKVKITI